MKMYNEMCNENKMCHIPAVTGPCLWPIAIVTETRIGKQ